jgi:hypothetical protein
VVWYEISPGVSLTTVDQRYVEHSVQELVSQRIHGLVLGYEDLNDHDHLRRDPVHGLISGKNDPLGQDRILERDKGKALAGHSTLNRLELSAQAIDARYCKIQVQPDEVPELLIKRGVKATAFAEIFLFWHNCAIVNGMPVMARWRHCRRSCLPFANVLATRFGSSCVPIAALPVM